MGIFGSNTTVDPTSASIFVGWTRGLEVYESGLLVRCYLPAKRNGVVGLYEVVHGVFMPPTIGTLYDAARPYDAEVEYLESDGVNPMSIITGIYVQEGLDVYVEYMVMSYTNYGYVIGNQGSTSHYFIVRQYGTTGKYNIAFPGATTQYNSTDQIPLQTKINGHYSTWNGNQYFEADGVRIASATTTYTATSTYPITLFSASAKNFHGNVRIYKCTIYLHNVKVAELIPVRLDGVGYMYDKVRGIRIGNTLSGTFTIGPDITQ
jgi:hypothetical protein